MLRLALRQSGNPTLLIADLDEDDVALRRGALDNLDLGGRLRREAGLLRHAEIGHPAIVQFLQDRVVPRADLVTVSSQALSGALVRTGAPIIVVPHARETRAYSPPLPSERLRLGFLGTPRAYKGTSTLLGLLEAIPAAELHLLGQQMPEPFAGRTDVAARVRLHPQRGARTLEDAFAHVDVVVLPQDERSVQTRLQLPAKLIDALIHGRPVVATSTPPILEVGTDHVMTVPTWRPLDGAVSILRGLAALSPEERERRGRAANAYAVANVSTAVVSDRVRASLTPLSA
jgi:glycosyltransferase involved in cell wall biosynthesis